MQFRSICLMENIQFPEPYPIMILKIVLLILLLFLINLYIVLFCNFIYKYILGLNVYSFSIFLIYPPIFQE